MLYQRPTFTCPASSKTDQERWDFAFLTIDEFRAKYGMDAGEQWKKSSTAST